LKVIISLVTMLSISGYSLIRIYQSDSVEKRTSQSEKEWLNKRFKRIDDLNILRSRIEKNNPSQLKAILSDNPSYNFNISTKTLDEAQRAGEKFDLATQRFKNTIRGLQTAAAENDWKRISKVSSEISLATEFIDGAKAFTKFNATYRTKVSELRQILSLGTLKVDSENLINKYITEADSALSEMQIAKEAKEKVEKIKVQALTSLEKEISSVSDMNAPLEINHSKSLPLAPFALQIIIATLCAYLYHTEKRKNKTELSAYMIDRKVMKQLIDKSEVGMAFFDVAGKRLSANKNFEKTLSCFEAPQLNSWQSFSSAIGLDVDLKALPDGMQEFPIVLKKEGEFALDMGLRLAKDESTNRVMALLFKLPNTPPIELPLSAKQEAVYPVEKIGLSSILEDVLSDLSPFFQANKIVVNLQNDQDFMLMGDLEVLRTNLTALTKDIGRVAQLGNGPRKIDILTTKDKNICTINFLIHGAPLNSQLIHAQISQDDQNWTLDKSLTQVENSLRNYQARFELKNNFNEKSQFLFSNINLHLS
jgi:hypothetical protein